MDLGKLKGGKITYLILVLLAGVVMIMLSGSLQKEPPGQESLVETRAEPDPAHIETRLEEIIETIDGVSDVSVFVNYDNSGKREVVFDREESLSSDGKKSTSSRKAQVITEKDGSRESPFVSEELCPRIRGAIICAAGVEKEEVRLAIADAVSGALGVPVHRVRVLPKD